MKVRNFDDFFEEKLLTKNKSDRNGLSGKVIPFI